MKIAIALLIILIFMILWELDRDFKIQKRQKELENKINGFLKHQMRIEKIGAGLEKKIKELEKGIKKKD